MHVKVKGEWFLARHSTPVFPNGGKQGQPLKTPKLLPPPSGGRGRPGAGPQQWTLAKRERHYGAGAAPVSGG